MNPKSQQSRIIIMIALLYIIDRLFYNFIFGHCPLLEYLINT